MPELSRVRTSIQLRGSVRIAVVIAVPVVAFALAACGGGASASSTTAGAGGNRTSAGTSTPAAGTSAAATSKASGPDACAIVTPAQLAQATGTTFAAGVAEPSQIGGSTCDFSRRPVPATVPWSCR
jgi:hypothetical protein